MKWFIGDSIHFNYCRLHQLFLEERIENSCSDPARLVKLRKKQLNGSAVDSKTGKGYMEKILEISSPDHEMVCETSITPLPVKLMSDDSGENGIKILEITSVSPVKRSSQNEGTQSSPPNEQELELKLSPEMDREISGDLVQVHEEVSVGMTDELSFNHPKVPDETEWVVDEQKKRDYILDGYHSDDVTSEVDDYMDALATMEELEADIECRPKKSLLNSQKVGKEEHQLQAQFSDSQSFGDSLTSEEIDSFDQDRNGEQTEVQARLSDSQSTGSSSASDDNRSSRRDRIEEQTQLQARFSDSQSVGNSSTSEIENMLSNQLPQTVELQRTHCGEFVMHDDAHVYGEEISDSRPVSSGLGLMDSGHSLLSSDIGPTSSVSLPTGTQSGETASGPAEIHLRLEEHEGRKSLVESLIKDDACPVVSSDNKSLNNLDVCDPSVSSYALLQVSDDLNLAHQDEYGDHSTTKVLQEQSPNQYSSRILVSGDIGSQGEDPICPSMEADLNSGTKLPLDGQDLKSENGVIATQHSSEDLSSVLETPAVSSCTEELCSDFTHGKPQDEPDSAEAEVLTSDWQSNFDEVPRMVLGDEKRGSKVEDDGHSKHLSSPDYIRQDNLVIVNDMSIERVHSEDQVLSALHLVDSAENDASILTSLASGFFSSPTRNISDLHEPFSSSNCHQTEIESNEAELTKISIDLNSEQRENKLEPSSYITSSPMKRLTKLEGSLSTIADSPEKEMEVNEAVAQKSLTALVAPEAVDQFEIAFADVRSNPSRSVPYDPSDSEICSNIQGSCLKEKIQQKLPDQPEIASADVQPNLNRSVSCVSSDSEICNDIQEEKIQYGSAVNDMKMVPVSSELDSQRLESIFLCQNDVQNSKDSFSSPSYSQLKPEMYLEMFLKSPVGQENAEVLLRNEEHYTSEKFQLQQIQISNQLEQQRISHAASELSPEIHPDEPSSFDSSSKLSLQETSRAKYVMDPLQPLLPDLFVEATNNHEEMPPMPPLPPMQWRMGKVQHASLVSQREEIEASQASFQPIQPVKPDDKSQFGFSTSDREAVLYQNPFLPVTAVERNQLQHSSGFLAGVSEHPFAIPLQFPVMVNESNGQFNYLVMERSQNQNPFLSLPVVSTVRPPHGYVIASEGEMVQNSSPCPSIPPTECSVSEADPISPQEKPTESPSQLMEKTSLEVKDGPSELHLVPPSECAVSGDDPTSPKENPTPRQLMEETSLEVKTLEQPSIYLESEKGDPSISPMSPPSIEVVQPNDSSLPSKGEMALSSDSSAQTQEFDSEMPNGKPKSKLPRLRSPLVDAVAALDKSKVMTIFEFSKSVPLCSLNSCITCCL